MSADNWGECPKCGKGDNTKHIHMRDAMSRSGRINHQGIPFREDYEIGVYDGVFDISYRGLCNSCGFKHEYNHKEDLS